MSKKKSSGGIVYSTDPNYTYASDDASAVTLAPDQQPLRVRIDTKQRAGKVVTLVEGFTGTEDDLEQLGKQLKSICGTGGAVKDGVVIIQGNHADKILQWLLKQGYKLARKY